MCIPNAKKARNETILAKGLSAKLIIVLLVLDNEIESFFPIGNTPSFIVSIFDEH